MESQKELLKFTNIVGEIIQQSCDNCQINVNFLKILNKIIFFVSTKYSQYSFDKKKYLRPDCKIIKKKSDDLNFNHDYKLEE